MWTETQQKKARYAENQMKAMQARNEYLLTIDDANAALEKYFVEDLPLLIEVWTGRRFYWVLNQLFIDAWNFIMAWLLLNILLNSLSKMTQSTACSVAVSLATGG